jgi:hypothetical protein
MSPVASSSQGESWYEKPRRGLSVIYKDRALVLEKRGENVNIPTEKYQQQ